MTVMDLVHESDVVTKNRSVDYFIATWLLGTILNVSSYSEFARVFGVDFMSVITRGSQFKVEAFMFRLAKPESFMLVSPSREDVRPSLPPLNGFD